MESLHPGFWILCSEKGHLHVQLTICKRYHVYHANKNVMNTPTYMARSHVQLDDFKIKSVEFYSTSFFFKIFPNSPLSKQNSKFGISEEKENRLIGTCD